MALLKPQSLPDVYVPTFEMMVGGQKLETSLAKSIMDITVTELLNAPSSFSFRLNDPKLALIDEKKGPFTEGTRVEITLGFVGNTRKMVVGEISALTADLSSSGPATVEVQGFDFFHGLSRGTVFRKFGGEGSPASALRDSEIVFRIAKEMQLHPSVNETPERTPARIQNNETNLAFLQRLAKLNGFMVRVDGGTLYFRKTPPEHPDAFRLEWGKNLLSFSPRLSTAGLVNEVVVQGWDPIQKHRFSATAKREGAGGVAQSGLNQINKGSGGRSQRIVRDVLVSSLLEAKTLADSILRNQQVTTVTGTGTCLGNPAMRAGTKLELSGIGRFNGSYFVTMVTHTVGANGYLTSFEVNSDSGKSAPDLANVPGSSSDSDGRGAGGVVVGLVLDNQDPEGLGRVKINLPGASDGEIGHWARVAAPMAGDGRGMFFLPEKRDEVLVAFEQGDITRPYVLGALWNGQDKPPESNSDGQNNLRLIKSRSGHLIRLDDSVDAEKIEIIDKSGANSVTVDTASNTILIKSAQDVVIEAPQGKISLSAQSVEVKSTGDTKVEAQTSMDLKANGTMTIKGQRVNIN
jgi:phage protein D/phage baseplate assembly protein gpV